MRVDPAHPWQVPCDVSRATKVWALSPHDNATINAMASACDRCGEQLSFVRGRHGEIMERDGAVWGGQTSTTQAKRGGGDIRCEKCKQQDGAGGCAACGLPSCAAAMSLSARFLPLLSRLTFASVSRSLALLSVLFLQLRRHR